MKGTLPAIQEGMKTSSHSLLKLFGAGVTTISVAAELSLDTLAEYMELSDLNEVSVSYRFVPGKETPRLARERSKSLSPKPERQGKASSPSF